YLHALKLFPLVDNNWYNWPLQFCLAANKTQKRYLAIHVELWMIRCFLVHEFYLVKDSTSKCDIFALCAVIADIELIIVVDAQDMFECPWNVDNGFILFVGVISNIMWTREHEALIKKEKEDVIHALQV
ncbi:hypothetical protein ACJX0J_038614, partial [Zea mays]